MSHFPTSYLNDDTPEGFIVSGKVEVNFGVGHLK